MPRRQPDANDSSSDGTDDGPTGAVNRRALMKASGVLGLGAIATGGLVSETDPAAATGTSGDDATYPLTMSGLTETGYYKVDGRPLYSTEARQVYVDPDDGDDANSGSETDPVRTVQEAADRMAMWQLHEYEIRLAKPNPTNVYDAPNFPPSVLGYDEQNGTGNSGKMFTIIGDRSNPSDYPFERGSKLGIGFGWNTDVPGAEVKGVELGGVSLDGSCSFLNCNFTGWTANETAITGYSGRAELRGCTVTSDATYAIGASHGKWVHGRYNTFNCNYVCNSGTDTGAIIQLASDPGIPFFESESAANDSNAYIQTGGAKLSGSGQLY